MSTYADPAAFAALPRTTGLALSPDGRRLVAVVQRPDAKGARYVSALWEIPLEGGNPFRLTSSEQGESAPAFRPDGSLLFVSARPDPEGGAGTEDESALWVLPPTGEARVVARRPGGLTGPVVAAGAGTVLAWGSRLAGSTDEDDDKRRTVRKDRKITAILHTGLPIRFWDHELDDTVTELVRLDDDRSTSLAPDAGPALTNGDVSISADGRTAVVTWRTRRPRGRFPYGYAVLDLAAGTRTLYLDADDVHLGSPRISPDGRSVAVVRETDGDFDTPATTAVQVRTADGGDVVCRADIGDLYPSELVWARDGSVLFVSGDLHGRGAVLAVDPATGAARTVVADAAYSALCPSPDGALYALRSTVDAPAAPVRIDPAAAGAAPQALPDPAPVPALPGRLEELTVEVDGAPVHAWLCLPEPADGPAPLMQWIHGGPFMSYNAWSWRWSPWGAVAQGWAVLMPDPALSTGYGPDFIARAWPHRAGLVWRDIEAVLDTVVARPDIDAERTACLGASFGGFMTNWVAGHTERFAAIVTHAGLWALDQQHTTTDGAAWKSNLFGTPADHPEWYAENSPHHFVDRINTPMLVIHGNRDYRVPVSEALRLWWDLVSRHQGDPETLPHRFLQLTGENHWVLSPANAEVWWDAVLGFCGQHVLGKDWTPSALL